jgi:Uma2 family endonuclease
MGHTAALPNPTLIGVTPRFRLRLVRGYNSTWKQTDEGVFDAMAVDQQYITRQSLAAPPPPEPIWRLSVEQYHEMINVGILDEDDQIELLEGLLIPKMPKNPPHRVTKELTHEALARMLPPGWHASEQEPITTEDSEPEPDVTVIRGARRDYLERHPGPSDLALVIEVSNTTLRRDRGLKKRIYARAGIQVYWIINLLENRIEIYTDPTGEAEEPDYRRRQDYFPDDEIQVVIEGREIGRLAARDMLP